jgi:hypothetical protein
MEKELTYFDIPDTTVLKCLDLYRHVSRSVQRNFIVWQRRSRSPDSSGMLKGYVMIQYGCPCQPNVWSLIDAAVIKWQLLSIFNDQCQMDTPAYMIYLLSANEDGNNWYCHQRLLPLTVMSNTLGSSCTRINWHFYRFRI